MNLVKQIICMKWGTLYGAEYVNRLYAMANKHISGEFRFVCLTDNSNGLDEKIECYDCPTINLPMPQAKQGWRKLTLYRNSKHLFGLKGTWLYLDLDVVINGSLDPFFDYKKDKNFIVMQNWTQPGKGIGNTSVYRFNIGTDEYLFDNLIQNQDEILSKYRNSQTYISKNVKSINFWPDEWCVLFKTHCVPKWPLRFFVEPYLPQKSRVIAFPGDPNPHDAVKGIWPAKKAYKKLYKYIKPAIWIQTIWDNAEKELKNVGTN